MSSCIRHWAEVGSHNVVPTEKSDVRRVFTGFEKYLCQDPAVA